MADSKTKTPTPVERVAELELQLSTVNGDLVKARENVTDLTGKLQKSEGDLITRNSELLTERKEHSESKLKLQTAEADFNSEKTKYDALKADFDSKVQTEAAKLAAANGLKPAAAAPAAKPGSTEEAPDKSKMTANELIAGDIKAATTR